MILRFRSKKATGNFTERTLTDHAVTFPLPSESLQASADILQHNLRYLIDILTQHSDLFSRVAVHPSTNFPGRTQENLLLQMLRKKPEPDVAAAMDEGREKLARLASATPTTAATATATDQGRDRGGRGPAAEEQRRQTEELENTWSAAREFCIRRITQYATEEDDDPYTEEEREVLGIANVRTGLRKQLDDPYAEEDEDEDEDEEGDGQGGGGAALNDDDDDDDDDVMIVERPSAPSADATARPKGKSSKRKVKGISLENIMRFSARGEFMPT